MVTYTYKCPKCGTFDHQERISDERLTFCPICDNLVQVVIHNTPLFLRGGGWYKEGYSKNNQ